MLLKNKKLATYVLTGIIILQVFLLFLQFLVPPRHPNPPKSGGEDSAFPFILFFVFIPSLLLSKKNKMSERKRTLLIWGLAVLAAVVLALMAAVLVKTW